MGKRWTIERMNEFCEENAIGFLRTTPHILYPARAPAPRCGEGKNKSKKIEKRG